MNLRDSRHSLLRACQDGESVRISSAWEVVIHSRIPLQSSFSENYDRLRLFQRKPRPPGRSRALDCGAGFGRVSKGLLTNLFEVVRGRSPIYRETSQCFSDNDCEEQGKVGKNMLDLVVFRLTCSSRIRSSSTLPMSNWVINGVR